MTAKIRPSFLVFINKFGDVPLKCVEIGVRDGDNAYEMLSYAPNIHLTLVDPYTIYGEERQQDKMDKHYENMLSKLDKFKDRITIIKKTSKEASKMFDDKTFDYIYIDGAHTISDVMVDIMFWDDKLKHYGIMAGHDFNMSNIRQAVRSVYEPTKRTIFACITENTTIIPLTYTDCIDWWVHKEIHTEETG
jgi:hypothetical protein